MKSFASNANVFFNIQDFSIEDLKLEYFIDFTSMNRLIRIESLSDQKAISLLFIYPTFIYFSGWDFIKHSRLKSVFFYPNFNLQSSNYSRDSCKYRSFCNPKVPLVFWIFVKSINFSCWFGYIWYFPRRIFILFLVKIEKVCWIKGLLLQTILAFNLHFYMKMIWLFIFIFVFFYCWTYVRYFCLLPDFSLIDFDLFV